MMEWIVIYRSLHHNGFGYSYNLQNNNFNYRFNNAPYWPQNSQRSIGNGTRANNNIKQVQKSKKSTTNKKNQESTTNRKALEDANFKKGLETKIDEGNRGYELLKKMGYQEGQGLGKDASGMLLPLSLEIKNDRKGLGAEKKPPIPEATKKTAEPAPLTKSQRKAIRRRANKEANAQLLSKTASSAAKQSVVTVKTETVAKPIQTKAQNVKDNVTKPENKTSAGKVENVVAKNQDVAKQQKETESKSVAEKVTDPKIIRRKHSPIRSPDSQPPPLKTTRLTVMKDLEFSPPKTLMSSINSFDPKSLLKTFNSEIELMQLRLEAAASSKAFHDDDDLIVVKICIGNDQNIANHAFEFIRTELVGWIGLYQDQGSGTPIFHSMTNNERHITVVCDNAYSYKCLEHCIEDIAQMKTMGIVKLVRLPPITSLIYCADAVYDAIARDADLFRKQIQMHKPKLNVDQWIIVSHEVCALERKTYFMFLIDERSALALSFQYSNSFCICMHKLVIRNRGIVAEEYLN